MMRRTPTEKRLMRENEALKRQAESLRYRLDELLGAHLVNPVPALNGAKFRIVHLLAKRSPMVVRHEALIHAVCDRPDEFNQPVNTLKVHISRARKSLAEHSVEIETVHGLGYRMPPESKTKWDTLVNEANGLENAA